MSSEFPSAPPLPHEHKDHSKPLPGMEDARLLLGSPQFSENYAKLARANEDRDLRLAKEELEQRNRQAVRNIELPVIEGRALEIAQRHNPDLSSTDAAKRTLKKDWPEHCRLATEELTRENPTVDLQDNQVHFNDIATAVLTSREHENILAQTEIHRLERIALLKQKVAQGEVDRLLQSLERAQHYPPLQKALDAWGQAPDAAGDMGPNKHGYNSGIVHYFSYRAYSDKYGRCKHWPMSVDGFVEFSQSLAALLERPRAEDNPNIDQSAIFTDEHAQRRLLVLTKNRTFINAFAKPGEPFKVITVIPDYSPSRFTRDLEEELLINDQHKRNRLGESRRKEHFAEHPSKERAQVIRRFPTETEMIQQYERLGTPEYAKAYACALVLTREIAAAGGRALFVGGSVRDLFLGVTPKDFDLEVHGLPPEAIEKIAKQHGQAAWVGKAFGILQFTSPEKIGIDISLPRFDSLPPEAKDKEAQAAFGGSIMEAARRRDFTMNTLAADPLTGEIFDDFGGISDIQQRIIRVVDQERFQDDPLRVLRAAQFVSRFGMHITPESLAFMRTVATRLPEIPHERIGKEWEKLLLKSRQPSIGIIAADSLGILDVLHASLRERALGTDEAIAGKYSIIAHPWTRMLARIDSVATLCRQEAIDSEQTLTFIITALAHHTQNPKKFLESVGAKKDSLIVIERILAEHDGLMELYLDDTLEDKALSDGEIRRLSTRLKPATIQQLALYLEGTYLGDMSIPGPLERTALPLPRQHNPARTWLVSRAKALNCDQGPAPDCITGKDWLAHLKAKGGRELGELIRLANELRDSHGMTRDAILESIPNATPLTDALKILQQSSLSNTKHPPH